MRISQSRMIRPMSFWGSVVAGLALTFVVPAYADDAPAAAEKPGAASTKKGPGGQAKAQKPGGLKGALKERKEGSPHEKGHPGGKKEDGEKSAHPMKKGPDGKPMKAKKRKRPPVSPKVAMGQYGKALAKLQEAESAAASSPEDAAKAEKELKAARRAVRRAKNSIRAAHRDDAKKLRQMSAPERKKLDLKLQMRAKKLSMDRKERSKKRQDELNAELGEKLKLAPVHAELERHAWRVARLERLIAIAEAAGRPESASRAKELLERENASHPERLKRAAANGKATAGIPKTGAASPAPKPTPPAKPAPVPLPAPALKKEIAQ